MPRTRPFHFGFSSEKSHDRGTPLNSVSAYDMVVLAVLVADEAEDSAADASLLALFYLGRRNASISCMAIRRIDCETPSAYPRRGSIRGQTIGQCKAAYGEGTGRHRTAPGGHVNTQINFCTSAVNDRHRQASHDALAIG